MDIISHLCPVISIIIALYWKGLVAVTPIIIALYWKGLVAVIPIIIALYWKGLVADNSKTKWKFDSMN